MQDYEFIIGDYLFSLSPIFIAVISASLTALFTSIGIFHINHFNHWKIDQIKTLRILITYKNSLHEYHAMILDAYKQFLKSKNPTGKYFKKLTDSIKFPYQIFDDLIHLLKETNFSPMGENKELNDLTQRHMISGLSLIFTIKNEELELDFIKKRIPPFLKRSESTIKTLELAATIIEDTSYRQYWLHHWGKFKHYFPFKFDKEQAAKIKKLHSDIDRLSKDHEALNRKLNPEDHANKINN